LTLAEENDIIISPTNLGGTRSRPENKIVALQGLSNDAGAILIDHISATKAIQVTVPKGEDILKCTTIADLENLTATGSRTITNFDCTPCLFPAPYETEIILKTGTNDCFELILALVHGAKTFDEANKEISSIQKASEHVFHSIRWLWANGKGLIEATKYVIDNDDKEMKAYKKDRHEKCILPPIEIHDSSFSSSNQLITTLSKINETTQESNTLRAIEIERNRERDEAKKDRIKKGWMHSSVERMILNAASEDGEHPAIDLSEDFKSCFNAESAGACGKQLIYLLGNAGYKNTVISEGAVNAIYHGEIISTTPNTPKHHTAFNYREAEPMQGTQAERFLVLHMETVNGKARSSEEIKASMAQTYTMPMDFNDMTDRIERYNGANGIIFSPTSLLVKRIETLANALQDHRIQIKACGSMDEEYFTKILYALDTRVNLWLLECMEHENREDVNDNLIDFGPLITQIALRDFRIDLPPCFKMITSSKKRAAADDNTTTNTATQSNSKKQKEEKVMVRNENQYAPFKLKNNEHYRNTFCGGGKAKKRPMFKSTQICGKWNIQGYCFDNCNMTESHVPHSEYTAEQKVAFGEWMKFCRETGGSN
jgi:hypothetical protein